MTERKRLNIYLLVLIIFLLSTGIRIPFKSEMFVNWDGPQFAVAMDNYSIKDYFPAPPGHFLYVMAAKLLNCFVNDHFSSLLYLSIFFSGLICVALFLIGLRLFSFKTGLIAALLYISSPLFWFYSTTITSLPMSGFFALLSGFFLFEVLYRKQEKYFVWASLFYGILIGIRPQDFIFILPFWLWAFFKSKPKIKVLSVLFLICVCFMWFIPLTLMSGGLKEFFGFLSEKVSSGSSRLSSSVFNTPNLLKANLKYQIIVYILTFGLGAIPFFYYLPQFFNLKSILSDRRSQIFLVWIIPALIFWSIYNFATPGYIIVSLLPITILLAEFLNRLAMEFSENIKIRYLKSRNALLVSVLFIIVTVNTVIYFYDFHIQPKEDYADSFRRYPDSKRIEARLFSKIQYIKDNVPKDDSIIIASFPFFMQVMYYLSDYHVYLFNAITSREDKVLYAHRFRRQEFYNFDASKLLSNNKWKQIVFCDKKFKDWFEVQPEKRTLSLNSSSELRIVYK